jgi:hypothetical protein
MVIVVSDVFTFVDVSSMFGVVTDVVGVDVGTDVVIGVVIGTDVVGPDDAVVELLTGGDVTVVCIIGVASAEKQ